MGGPANCRTPNPVGVWTTEIRPYITWWSCLIIASIVACLVVLPIVVYNTAASSEQNVLDHRFFEAATTEMRNIGVIAARTLRVLQNMRIPVRLEGDNLTFTQFHESAELLAKPESVTQILWLPLVRNADKEAFEQRIRTLNGAIEPSLANYTILEVRSNRTYFNPSLPLTLEPAENRSLYMPATYLWTSPKLIVSGTRVGVDALTHPAFSNDAFTPFLTGIAKLKTNAVISFDRRKRGLFVFTPVYSSFQKPATTAERASLAVGQLAALTGLSAMVEEARAYTASIHVYIFDETRIDSLYCEAGMPEVTSADAIPSVHRARFEGSFSVEDRNWTFVAVPTRHLVNDAITYEPEIFATVTAVGFFLLLVGAMVAIRKIVHTQANMAVSERRRRLVNEMIGYVNHEIRNPLNGIVGLVDHASETTKDCLRATTPDKESIKAIALDLRDTVSMCDLMKHIIDDVLDIRCLDEGRLKIIPAPTRLSRLLSDVAAIVQLKMTEKPSLSLTFDPFDTTAVIVCDAVRVKQMLLNFIINSIKYSESGPIVVRRAHGGLDRRADAVQRAGWRAGHRGVQKGARLQTVHASQRWRATPGRRTRPVPMLHAC
eukprot:Opistho-2@33956